MGKNGYQNCIFLPNCQFQRILALCSDWGILLVNNQVDQGELAFGYTHTEPDLEMYLGLTVSYISTKRNDVNNTSRAPFQAVVTQEMAIESLEQYIQLINIEYLPTSTSHYIDMH